LPEVFALFWDIWLLDKRLLPEALIHFSFGDDVLAIPATIKLVAGCLEFDRDGDGEL